MRALDFVVLYGLAFLLPLGVTLVLTPAAARLAVRVGILDRPGERKVHAHAVPYLGGLAVAGGLVVAGLLTGSSELQLLVILGCAAIIATLGLVDDWRTVGPGVKLAVQAGAGVALWGAGVRAGLFGIPFLDLGLTVAWIVVITNAINLVDNMDGLASGITAIAAIAYLAIAGGHGDYLVSMYAAALAGASLGFLRHNFPPARIFLGDAGSLLMGFLLASLALKLDLVGEGGLVRAAIPALILGIPVFDTALVVLSRRLRGRPVLQGGMDHSSHRLARLGLSGRTVAAVLFLAQFACSAGGVWLAYAPDRIAGLTVLACVAAGIGGSIPLARWRRVRVPVPQRAGDGVGLGMTPLR